ncbi:hypothetical protein JAAARDRAFT_36351 [Jaapia argillacea MUCL 33604]|uniref:Uncharacterized protein n=1 Tax=Jaapia argillacea MUCL 33604 TaxID=933084 RepID=A0A067Q2Q5_9AGAM|nr:hypothetical protein JAAARDRAFT_36351 [Jaapia argillacea MUCL 33604]
MNNGFSSAPNEEGLLDVLQYSNAYTHRPPPRATWYRISCILFVTGFGIPKAILGYNNWVFASVSLDLVFGVVVTILLMVAGWYELDPPKRWRWFFETDWQELYWKPCEGYIERQSPYIQQLFIGFSTLLGLWTGPYIISDPCASLLNYSSSYPSVW